MAKPKNLEQLRAEKEQVETQLAQEQHMPCYGMPNHDSRRNYSIDL